MDQPGGRTPPRKFAIALAAVPLVAVLLSDAGLLFHRATQAKPSGHPVATHNATGQARPDTQAERRAALARATAIRTLLARRGDAVVHHDRAEWLSTLDPGTRAFRVAQLRVFANLRKVRFASWSYTFDAHDAQVPDTRSKRYGVEAWAPLHFAVHYRLSGFDPAPTSLAQFPTFVHRGGTWLLASLNDFASEGMRSSSDLWDFRPVVVVRTSQVLVLGHPGAETLMSSLAAEVTADIPRVTAVWGRAWPRRVVVLAPDTQHELGRVVEDSGDLDHIAAVATAEVQSGSGKPDPVGDRIGINPSNWPQLSLLGRQIVLTHELTHIATRAVTSVATPTWLAEGFADYVGYLGSGVPTPFVAQDLGADVRAGHVPLVLPPDGQFDGSSKRLSQAYEGAWLACRLIAQRWGQQALVRFYVEVGRSSDASSTAVALAMQRVFHLSPHAFVGQWRGFLRSELD